MNGQTANTVMIRKLLFRLLPVQILLAAIGSVNGIVSSFFASNFVGVSAMSAVGLYSPIGMLISTISTVLVGGSTILCGKYMGRNKQDRVRNVFSLNLILSLMISVCFILLYLVLGLFDLTRFLTADPAVRGLFNRYLVGQTVSVVPQMLGSSFAAFLSLENRRQRTLTASISFIAANILFNFLFVQQLHMEALGLALANGLGMWVFLGVQAQYFLTGKSHFSIKLQMPDWKQALEILQVGLPGAASYLYQTARGLIVNKLLEIFVGSVGISAFAAANNLLGLVWALPGGMLAVSRMVISVSVGEEDRQSLTDVMRVMFRWFLPLMSAVSLAVILGSVPLTRFFYRNPADPVFMMTVWGFRILPLCMPLAVIAMHFTCYGQASDRQVLVHLTALLDGLVCVAGFTALLIPRIGMNSVYIANVLNGLVTVLVFFGYAWLKNRHIPRSMEELLAIPRDFGVPEEERLDLTVKSREDVVAVAERIQHFCLDRGISERSAYLAGLSMEEMAGNVVDHGFSKDRKSHTIDIRVVHKDERVILRIKDDCVPFDPHQRQEMTESEDPVRNIGIRLVFKAATEVQYQNILGLNVLTVRFVDEAYRGRHTAAL